MTIAPIPELVAELAAGRMVILVDEEDRENEGDLVLAADHVTPEAINFMARYGRGLICLTLTRERCEHLQLPPMAAKNGAQHGTAFTVSIEAANGVTTGISAADRARTVQAAVRRDAKPSDLVQPGHIFPLQAQDGGVLMRAGHTEAGCDLAAMAGLTPAAVICEVMNDDGTMARLPDLIAFADAHGLKIGTIAEPDRAPQPQRIADRARRHAQAADPAGRVHLHRLSRPHRRRRTSRSPTAAGRRADEVLVRVHEPLSVLDLLDAGPRRSLVAAAARARRAAAQRARRRRPAQLRRRRRDAAAARARAQPRRAPAPMPMDLRTYGIGAQILRDLGVGRMKLLGSPRRMPSMLGYGLEVTGFVADEPAVPPPPPCMRNADQRRARARLDGRELRIGIVQARFNAELTDRLAARAARSWPRSASPRTDITHVTVPGALEIGVALNALADADEHDALVAIGCVIRGETYHFELVANESGAARDARRHRPRPADRQRHPHLRQRRRRPSARADEKGRDAARVAVEMANLLDDLS